MWIFGLLVENDIDGSSLIEKNDFALSISKQQYMYDVIQFYLDIDTFILKYNYSIHEETNHMLKEAIESKTLKDRKRYVCCRNNSKTHMLKVVNVF